MPIVYESPAPIAAFGAVSQQAAQNDVRARQVAAAASAFSQGGGFGGTRGRSVYDDGDNIQAAIFGRDQMQFNRERDAIDRSVSQTEKFRADSEMARDRQRFQLQAELQQTELSQQENMRLARMKNAVGEVQADASLSDEDKADLMIQLRTGIDPLQHRLAKQRLAMDQQEKEARTEQYQQMAALRKEEAAVTAKTADERMSFLPDPRALAEIAEDIKANLPFIPGVGAPPAEMVAKMAHQEAMRQGLGAYKFQSGYGKWDDVDFDGETGKGKAVSGKVRDAQAHPSGMSAEQFLKMHEDARSEALKEQARKDPVSGNFLNPQDNSWTEDRIGQIVGRHKKALAEYNSQRPAPAENAAGGKRYKSRFAKPEPAAAAGSGSGPSAAADKPEARAEATSNIDRAMESIKTAKELSPQDKSDASIGVAAMKALYDKYGSQGAIMAGPDRQKWVDLDNKLSEFMRRATNPGRTWTPEEEFGRMSDR